MRSSAITAASLLPATAYAFAVNGGSGVQFSRSLGERQEREAVNSTTLQDAVTLDAMLAHAEALQGFAYAYPSRNRLIGSGGHNDSVAYFQKTLEELDGYYNISLQPFSATSYSEGEHELTVNGTVTEHSSMSFAPNGDVDDVLVAASNLGCAAEDFSAEVAGHIALISRGECPFAQKVTLAGQAGAAAAIIYNNAPGSVAGTLGQPSDEFIPVLAVTQDIGLSYVEVLNAGNTVTAHVVIDGASTDVTTTNNVIAQTVGGDQENVIHLGAHSDSVAAGPGINDNGSGSIALLEIAKQLAAFDVTNAVRFSWWSAEEEGLLGSEFYVAELPEEERAKIRLYLNFDMIASPNYVLAAYDGDGSEFGVEGAPGSAEAEKLFHDYFDSVGSNWTQSEFNGRSDYGPFLDAGIACGGLDTGAEGIKTEEEAAKFGGEAGVAYDINYHGVGDTVDNLALPALEINSKAIAHAVATYATSFDSLPEKAPVASAQRVAQVKQEKTIKGDKDLV